MFARDLDAKEDKWSVLIAVRVRAMVAAGDKLFVAGPPDVVPEDDPLATFEGRLGAALWAFSADDGEKLAVRAASLPGVPQLVQPKGNPGPGGLGGRPPEALGASFWLHQEPK